MRIIVDRFGFGLDSTLGEMRTKDGTVQCFTLEDERRRVKVRAETCIPPGGYRVKIRDDSPKYQKFDERWDWHRGMLWLQDVPGFEFIYIHPGNSDDHTEGCILVGDVPVVMPDGEFQVSRSRAAYERIYKPIREAIDRGEGVHVVVIERAMV